MNMFQTNEIKILVLLRPPGSSKIAEIQIINWGIVWFSNNFPQKFILESLKAQGGLSTGHLFVSSEVSLDSTLTVS